MKKHIFILLLVYIVSILAITVCVEKINALSILGIFACQLIVSVILLNLFKDKNNLKTLVGINIAFFSIYNILQNFFILTGSRLERVLQNSNFVNSNNFSQSLDSPIENTIIGIVIVVVIHWFVFYRLNRD